MELIGVLAFIAGWIILGVLSNRYGHDSRDRYYDPPIQTLAGFTRGDPAVSPGGRRAGLTLATRARPDSAASKRGQPSPRPMPEPAGSAVS
jgi:hypothetical protein